MKQEVIFLKLIDVISDVGENRAKTKKRGKKEEHRKENDSERHERHKKKRENKMSPVSKKILCLLLNEDKLNQRTLATNCKVSGQAVSEALKKLEQRELIIKIQGDVNNENLISLSDKGKEKAKHLQEKIRETSVKLLDGFSDDELETLLKLLEKIEINKENMIINDTTDSNENEEG